MFGHSAGALAGLLAEPALRHRLLAMVRDDAATDTPDMWSLTRAVWTANFVRGGAAASVAAAPDETPPRFD